MTPATIAKSGGLAPGGDRAGLLISTQQEGGGRECQCKRSEISGRTGKGASTKGMARVLTGVPLAMMLLS